VDEHPRVFAKSAVNVYVSCRFGENTGMSFSAISFIHSVLRAYLRFSIYLFSSFSRRTVEMNNTSVERSPSISDAFRGRRVVEKTKKCYLSKLNNMKTFFLTDIERYGRYLDAYGNLIAPFDFTDLKLLFGWLSVNTDIPMQRGRLRQRAAQGGEDVRDEDGDDAEDNDTDSVDDDTMIAGTTIQHPNDRFLALSQQTMSISSYQAHKSALVWLYKEQNVTLSTEQATYLDDVICGYKKTVAEKKSLGVMSLTEGKSPISFHGYVGIANVCLHLQPEQNSTRRQKSSFAEGIFSWIYFLLCWNLMCRTNTTSKIALDHISWKEDCL